MNILLILVFQIQALSVSSLKNLRSMLLYSLVCVCVLVMIPSSVFMFTCICTIWCHNKKIRWFHASHNDLHSIGIMWSLPSIYHWTASSRSAWCKWSIIFKVICHYWVMWFPRSFVWGMEGIHQQLTLPFESMQHVSSVVKDWILGMDDWPQGQCKLCWAEWWPQGGEAERKWTWRSDQNIVWQGNKVNWSRLQFFWKLNQWGFC